MASALTDPNETAVAEPKLSVYFDEIWKMYQYLEDCNDPTPTDAVQARVKQGIVRAEKAIQMVNELNLFSNNEELDEVATNEIRYLILPALLGYFLGKNTILNRSKVIKKQQGHFTDFLNLCKWYGVTNAEIPDIDEEDKQPQDQTSERTGVTGVMANAQRRSNKIEKFKQQRETETKLKDLFSLMQQDHVDEEVKRDYYTTLLKMWVNTALDELDSLKFELEILNQRAKNGTAAEASKPKPKQFRPFILTKDRLQKEVFGAGYPSLPAYTVEEWYDQQVAAGKLPTQEQAKSMMSQVNDPTAKSSEIEKQDLDKEEKLEKDDAETLQKARQWDEFKDDHRRGWGNRQNMG